MIWWLIIGAVVIGLICEFVVICPDKLPWWKGEEHKEEDDDE